MAYPGDGPARPFAADATRGRARSPAGFAHAAGTIMAPPLSWQVTQMRRMAADSRATIASARHQIAMTRKALDLAREIIIQTNKHLERCPPDARPPSSRK